MTLDVCWNWNGIDRNNIVGIVGENWNKVQNLEISGMRMGISPWVWEGMGTTIVIPFLL